MFYVDCEEEERRRRRREEGRSSLPRSQSVPTLLGIHWNIYIYTEKYKTMLFLGLKLGILIK